MASHSLRLSTKLQVYRAVVVPTFMYGAETHQRCLRFILGIKWQNHVSNEAVLNRASLPSIESILFQVQLGWSGHVTRMEDVCMPKAVFLSELQESTRKCDRGAPRKRYKDQLKRQLAQAGISHQSWQQETSDRDSWRSSVRKANCKFEAETHVAAKKNAGDRKSEQHPYHPQPKPSTVQSAVGCAHQESVSTATNERARIDHQPSRNPPLRGLSHHPILQKEHIEARHKSRVTVRFVPHATRHFHA